jgi:hypothetical protein
VTAAAILIDRDIATRDDVPPAAQVAFNIWLPTDLCHGLPRTLRRVRYKELPKGVFLGSATRQNMGFIVGGR